MGLDIRAFSGLKESCQGVIKDGEIVSPDTEEYLGSNLTYFTQLPVYSDWGQYIKLNQVYSYSEKFSFHAGSYSGYSQFRLWLMNLVLDISDGIVPGDPFYELVIFSDCEGVIDWSIAQKLHRDFVLYDHKARTSKEANYFYGMYQGFTEAFRIASVGGAVKFT